VLGSGATAAYDLAGPPADEGGAGCGAGPPGGDAVRGGGEECRVRRPGMLGLAGFADAHAGRGGGRSHADPLLEGPGISGARDHDGRPWREADHGRGEGVGLGAVAA
jgi:hypothetical protein